MTDSDRETGEDDAEQELYEDALEIIRSAQKDRERQHPKIEALRRSWKDELEDLDEKKGALWIQCLIDYYTREIQDILDPDEEHEIDPDEWLEFGSEDRSVSIEQSEKADKEDV